MLRNTTSEERRWGAGGAVARPRLARPPPGWAACPIAAEARYLEDIGRRDVRCGEAPASDGPAASKETGSPGRAFRRDRA